MNNKQEIDDDHLPPSKKIKNIPFSTTEYLKKKIVIGDKTASVVGYIEDILGESTHVNREKQNEFHVFKFLLNNNDGCTIVCHIYNNLINKFKSHSGMKINQKIIIENAAIVETKFYSQSNLPWNINLQFYTVISDLGPFGVYKYVIPKVKFNDLASKRGMIKVNGYLRSPFIQKNDNNEYEYISCLAHKKRKLDLVLIKDEGKSINFIKGSKLEVLGKTLVLRVKNVDHIKILSDDDYMTEQDLLVAKEIFTIQPKDETKE
ncbi:uncharacterized protein LOC131672764 isoform X2 [Phymastichus coffea]|uniref:uncharacterized protein LOC131672764 isoform X2 n=1 Tax=Phymastichus coffea TaxID=108790 RepID=UPI00273A83EA|nr:uncharacterized protein LOC131672764 isoform X2 [Phymastichus coffea]